MMPFDAQKAASNNAKNRISKFEIVFEKFEKNCYCSVAQITFEYPLPIIEELYELTSFFGRIRTNFDTM